MRETTIEPIDAKRGQSSKVQRQAQSLLGQLATEQGSTRTGLAPVAPEIVMHTGDLRSARSKRRNNTLYVGKNQSIAFD